MFKTLGIAALAVVVALVVGFGARGATTPTAHAEATDVVVIGCEFIANAVDGLPADALLSTDVQAACGGLNALGVPANLPATAPAGSPSIANLALAIGDEDGILTASDFRSDSLDENWDQNQLSTDCTAAGRTYVTALAPILTGDFVNGLSCTLDVFTFVSHEGAVLLDLPAGLASVESSTTEDFLCINDATIATTGFTVNSVAIGGLFTTAVAHNLLVGDTVNIAAPIEGVPAGNYLVATVPTATTFTLTGVAGPASMAYTAGTIAIAIGGVAVGAPSIWTTAAWPFVATVGLVTGSQFTLAAAVPGTVPVIPAGTYTVATSSVPTTAFTTGVTVTTANTGATTLTPIFTISKLDANIRSDNDCNNGAAPGVGTLNNGDGVVLFHVLEGIGTAAANAGDVKTVTVSQDAVGQPFDVNVVGPANNVELTLAETVIETNGNPTNVTDCITNTQVTESVSPPTSTVAWAEVTDQDNTVLTRVPVFFAVTPPEDTEIAKIGVGFPPEEILSNTFFSVHPATTGLPTAAYVVICGGKATGTATIDASINQISCSSTNCTILSSRDHSTEDITVGGAPSSNVLTAEASAIKCDGTEKSTVTAKVTDSAGDNVADGVPVRFDVVALGTANPINTVTKDGIATSVVTPLSNSSAGVTVIVTAGDSGIASLVSTSVRVDCSLPLATQPTLAPAAAATPRGGIAGPDTGTGGYLNQNGSNGFPMWTLIALALGSMALVAGGLVTRRAGK